MRNRSLSCLDDVFMSQRFFVETPITADQVELTGGEAHHLAHVMRASVGDRIVLFDGSGVEFNAEIFRISKRSVTLGIVERIETNRETASPIVLGVAMPKGDRQKWLVEKSTELGVARLVPLVSERGVAQPTENSLAKLRRSVIEASKQCRRCRLMEISEPTDWRDFVRNAPHAARRWVAHPGGHQIDRSRAENAPPTYIAIGPEGGLTEKEIQLAVESGWTCVDLGERILRVETAAILLSAWAL